MIKSSVSKEWHGKEIKIQAKQVTGKTGYELGLIVEAQAKNLCPVDMGYLRASITTQSTTQGTELGQVVPDSSRHGTLSKGKKAQSAQHKSFWENMPENFRKITKPTDENEILVGSAVEYAVWVEFGTAKMNSQPYLRPALDLARGKTLTLGMENGKFYFRDYLRRPS